jgi:glycosyltransferase involved in cell wall biosynthesis
MKVSFGRDFKKMSGIDNFLRQLAPALSDLGVKIVDKSQKCDIHLSPVSGHKPNCKNIIRIDGVYYDESRLRLNEAIRRAIKRADGVVFQSRWSRKFATRMLRVSPQKSAVVYNGASRSVYRNAKAIDKRGFDKVFVTCANWRPNKRPASIIRSFIAANEKSSQRLGLFVLGKISKIEIEHPNIVYFGSIRFDAVPQVLAASDFMVHICHLDSCPNAVVEGLLAGLPVLCNNIGGTPEIVGRSGIILNLDAPFDFKPIPRMKQVSKVDEAVLTSGMLDMLRHNWKIDRPDLDIKVIAKLYHKFFLQVLHE